MVRSWLEPADQFRIGIDASEVGSFDAVWSLTYTAEIGALRLAQLPGVDDDFAVTGAAGDLGDAVDALEQLRPELPHVAPAIDLGPAPLDDVQACRTALAGLILAGLAALGRAIADPETSSGEVAAASRVAPRLTSAFWRITGTVP